MKKRAFLFMGLAWVGSYLGSVSAGAEVEPQEVKTTVKTGVTATTPSAASTPTFSSQPTRAPFSAMTDPDFTVSETEGNQVNPSALESVECEVTGSQKTDCITKGFIVKEVMLAKGIMPSGSPPEHYNVLFLKSAKNQIKLTCASGNDCRNQKSLFDACLALALESKRSSRALALYFSGPNQLPAGVSKIRLGDLGPNGSEDPLYPINSTTGWVNYWPKFPNILEVVNSVPEMACQLK